jgi:hypothetical protein
MPESITQRLNAAPFSSAEARELAALIGSVRTDLNNANATIATDTTAAAVTLNTTA